MQSFLDLIKDGLVDSQTIGNMTVAGVLLALLLALVAGGIIYMIYKFSHAGVMFINNFAITLVGLTMVTSLIILTITSNLLLSLGMVGALSIVRFRTVIKEPMDMIYMFWAIATGVAIGAGFFILAGIGLVLISAVLFGLSRLSYRTDLYIMVIRKQGLNRQDVEAAINNHAKAMRFRAETHVNDQVEMTYELRLKASDDLMSALKVLSSDVSLVSYNTNTLL